MSEGPKLYANKPKKAQLKQIQREPQQPSSSMATQPPPSIKTPIPPPEPPKQSFARRYKFIWPLLLAVNLSVGAYLFMRTKKKDIDVEGGEVPDVQPTTTAATISSTAASVVEKSLSPPPAVILRKPITEDEQRELFKWILEEKRKVKPKDREEKKRIDEEKAIIKQFLRAKSIPNL